MTESELKRAREHYADQQKLLLWPELVAALESLADQFNDLHRVTFRGTFMVTKNESYAKARAVLARAKEIK